MCCFLSGDGSGGTAQSLAQVLVVGNTTGVDASTTGRDIIVSSGDSIQFVQRGTSPAAIAGRTITWVRSDGFEVCTLPDGTDNVIAPGAIPRTAVVTGNYTAALGETVLHNPTAGTYTISAPPTATNGATFAVKNVSVSITDVTLSGNGHNIQSPDTYSLASTAIVSGDGRYVSYRFSSQQNAWLSETSRDVAITTGEVTVVEIDFTAQGSVSIVNGAVNITDTRGVTSAWTASNINPATDTISMGAATGLQILTNSTTARAWSTTVTPTCILLSIPFLTLVPQWNSYQIYRYDIHYITQTMVNSVDGPIYGQVNQGSGVGNGYAVGFVRGPNAPPDPFVQINGGTVLSVFADTVGTLLGIASDCPNLVLSNVMSRGDAQLGFGVFGSTWPTTQSMRGVCSRNIATSTNEFPNNTFAIRGASGLVQSNFQIGFNNGTTGSLRTLQIGHIRIVRLLG